MTKANKAKKSTKFHLYRIDWIDAHTGGNIWHELQTYDMRDLIIHSVGWLVMENKDYYVLYQSINSDYRGADTIQIPKKWIKKVQRIPNHIIQYDHTR